jgi:hypothetical protein
LSWFRVVCDGGICTRYWAFELHRRQTINLFVFRLVTGRQVFEENLICSWSLPECNLLLSFQKVSISHILEEYRPVKILSTNLRDTMRRNSPEGGHLLITILPCTLVTGHTSALTSRPLTFLACSTAFYLLYLHYRRINQYHEVHLR